MTVKAAQMARFSELMERAIEHPNKLEKEKIRELAGLIPDYMHSMPEEKRRQWLDSFSNRTFIEFLMHGGQKELFAFGELCRQAYKFGALYKILGTIPLKSDALTAIQVEVEAQIQDTVKSSFFGKLFCVRPVARIPLDQSRFTPAVSNENRLKLNFAIADALLDVICKHEHHPCSKDIGSFPELRAIRDDAKLSVLRALEVSLGKDEVQFSIAKSCRRHEKSEKKKLLQKIEKAAKVRQELFETAKKRGIHIPIEYYQESAEQLQRAKQVVEKAETQGIDVTFAYDMVALDVADEKTYEAYLLATQQLTLFNELSWMKVSLSLNAAFQGHEAAKQELEKAFTLIFQSASISLIEKIKAHMTRLREVTITPMSLGILLKELPTMSPSAKKSFEERLRACSSYRDPNQIIQFQKIRDEIYSQVVAEPKSVAATEFIQRYEKCLNTK